MNLWLAGIILALSNPTASVAQSTGQWRSLDADQTSAFFFDQQSLQQIEPNASRASFAIAWKEPDDAVYPSFRIQNVSVVQELWESDCKASTIALVRRTYFSADGNQLQEVRASTPTMLTPKPATAGEEILNLLCGRPQMLGRMFEVGPAGLVRVVRETLVEPKPGAAAPN